jgi:hypothetical protein
MAIPTDRDSFKEYCLRALGDGVIQINVSDDQLEDRIDEALYVYQQFHMDGVVKAYLPHQITASYMTLTSYVANANGDTQFSNGEFATGASSFTTATLLDTTTNPANVGYFTTRSQKSDANLEQIYTGFTVGEQITGVTSGVKATVSAVRIGDYDNGWIPVVPAVIAVTKIFAPFDSRMSADILFDPQAQFNMSLLSNFTSNSIIPYYIGRSYQQLLNDTFRGRPAIRFQRHMGRLYIDVNMYTTFRPGYFVIVECLRCIDPDTYPLVWSDEWLQRYCIALIKRQWGTNLSKYTGIALPGNVQLDGKTMLTEAVQEVKDLKDELKSAYQLPVDFMVG